MPPPGKLTPHQIIVARNLKDGIVPPQKQPIINNPINTPIIDILKTPSITSNSNSNTLINQPTGLFDNIKNSNNNIQPNNMYIPNNISNNASDSKTNTVVTTQEPKKSYTSYIVGFVIIYLVFLRKK